MLRNNKSVKGFTLIELIVVIAILGLLITAALFTINPVDQINQANDVKAMNYVVQFGKSIHAQGSGLDKYYHSEQGSPNNPTCYYTRAAKYLKDNGILPSALQYSGSCTSTSTIGNYNYQYIAFNDNNNLCSSAGGNCSHFVIWVNLTSKKYLPYTHYSYDSDNGRGCFRTAAETPPYNGSRIIYPCTN